MEDEEASYQKKLKKRVAEAIKNAQIEQQKKEILKQFLDDKAYERIMNVRISNYDLYNQLVNMVVALAQNNRISGKLTEAQLKSIIEKMTYKREPTIEFKHK
ncbi:MAG: DNA-binding protein [Candidatus Micrarchaeaceae archaeon]|jgi:DNA-binding TFAR19-related protein (PDSD5 family)